jgi:transposase
MDLTVEQEAELRALLNSRGVSAAIATRARIVLWHAGSVARKEIGPLSGVSLPTVDRWVRRYAESGLAGLQELKPGAGRAQIDLRVRARILALSRATPPSETGLSQCSCRLLADYLGRTEGVKVSWHYIATVWHLGGSAPGPVGLSKCVRLACRILKCFLST